MPAPPSSWTKQPPRTLRRRNTTAGSSPTSQTGKNTAKRVPGGERAKVRASARVPREEVQTRGIPCTPAPRVGSAQAWRMLCWPGAPHPATCIRRTHNTTHQIRSNRLRLRLLVPYFLPVSCLFHRRHPFSAAPFPRGGSPPPPHTKESAAKGCRNSSMPLTAWRIP
jgi:hypothetical protein